MRPTVRLFAVCADAMLNGPPDGDLTAGWWELVNPYHTVWMPPGVSRGFMAERLYVYAQLTDGLGTFSLGVSVEQLDLASPQRDRLVGRSNPVAIKFEEEWDVHEVLFRLVDVPFPRPGRYRFRLLAGGVELDGASTELRVLSGEEQ